MAMAVKLQGVPRDAGLQIWSMDGIGWWDWRVLRGDPRFRQLPAGGWLEYAAVLTPPEARALQARFAPSAQAADRARVEELDRRLASSPPETCFVLASFYEWESGLE